MGTVLKHSESLALHQLDAETQHRRILQLIDDLSAAHERRRPPGHVAEALERLTEYLHLHCADEEQFLEEHGYPSNLLESHRAEHREIHEYLMDECARLTSDPTRNAAGVAGIVRLWVESHACSSDQAYLDYFGERQAI